MPTPGENSKRLHNVLAGLLLAATIVSGFSATGCTQKQEEKMPGEKSLYSAETVQTDGKNVVVLKRGGQSSLEVKICPDAGANLFSMVYEGNELIAGPENMAEFDGGALGTPVLYPAPNRVADGKFSFEGRSFDWGHNNKDRFLHALVRDVPWNFQVGSASENGVSVECWIDFAPGTELYGKFGFEHRLSLIYSLDEQGVMVRYRVQNRDERTLPFGFALHPYFNFLGSRESAILCAPAQAHMEAIDLMPTGKLEPLEGAAFDITEPTPVPELVLDDVYWGMRPEQPAWIEYRDAGIRLELASSAEFTHLVVYIQPQNNFFCVENQTCSTDAHNLHARGLVKESNLLLAGAGETSEGWVHYRISSLQ
jgi:aldose 1-epimerase